MSELRLGFQMQAVSHSTDEQETVARVWQDLGLGANGVGGKEGPTTLGPTPYQDSLGGLERADSVTWIIVLPGDSPRAITSLGLCCVRCRFPPHHTRSSLQPGLDPSGWPWQTPPGACAPEYLVFRRKQRSPGSLFTVGCPQDSGLEAAPHTGSEGILFSG